MYYNNIAPIIVYFDCVLKRIKVDHNNIDLRETNKILCKTNRSHNVLFFSFFSFFS